VNGTVEIEISDTGVGISPEFLPHVFDRFSQGDSGATRRHAGLGLGLAIAKQLVELHGGTIGVHSEGEGRGATFTVYLPLERKPVASAQERAEATLGQDALRGANVLLVEDEAMAREATARLLEQFGAQVRAVASAARAREAFATQHPDLIVAGISMAEEDGYALMRSLRTLEQQQSLTHAPSVAVTAFARSEDRQSALEAGFDEHMPKPVEPDRLVRVLAQLIRVRDEAWQSRS
jgi:CheY-like chemotaxis protein